SAVGERWDDRPRLVRGGAVVLRDRALADVAESHIRDCSAAWRTPLGYLRWPCPEERLTQRPPDLRYPARSNRRGALPPRVRPGHVPGRRPARRRGSHP